jgi:hypothetical protein
MLQKQSVMGKHDQPFKDAGVSIPTTAQGKWVLNDWYTDTGNKELKYLNMVTIIVVL